MLQSDEAVDEADGDEDVEVRRVHLVRLDAEDVRAAQRTPALAHAVHVAQQPLARATVGSERGGLRSREGFNAPAVAQTSTTRATMLVPSLCALEG